MAFDPTGGLTGWDLTGFHEGHDTECWKRLGAHEVTVIDAERGEIHGTRFSVWAPNAQAVRLVGDFNYWNGENSYMHLVPGAGVWALFVEGVEHRHLYKFEVLGADGVWRLKADPMARFSEAAPHTASIVYETQYAWGDDQWMWYRGEKKQYQEPMSIYEVHIGSWRKDLTYLELAKDWWSTAPGRATPTWSSCPSRSTRSAGPGATRSPATSRRCRGSAPPTSSGTWSTAAPGRGSGHRGLGPRALRHRPLGAAALRRHGAVRARGPAERLAADWGTYSSTSAATR